MYIIYIYTHAGFFAGGPSFSAGSTYPSLGSWLAGGSPQLLGYPAAGLVLDAASSLSIARLHMYWTEVFSCAAHLKGRTPRL